MSRGARVRSVGALGSFRAALGVYIEELENALAGAESETSRAVDWLRGTQLSYWSKEIVRRQEQVTRAKSAMFRAEAHTSRELGKSNVDERKALERAKLALREAERKRDVTKKLGVSLDRVATTYRGQVSGLSRLVSGDLPEAMELLKRLEKGLDEYIAYSPNEGGGESGGLGSSGVSSYARGAGEELKVEGEVVARWSSLLPTRQQRRLSKPVCLQGGRTRLIDHAGEVELESVLGEMSDDERVATPHGDRVLFVRGWAEAEQLLVYRSVKPSIGDSGWVIASAGCLRSRSEFDPDAEIGWVRAGELLGRYPELEGLMSYPFECGALLGVDEAGLGRCVSGVVDERRELSR